jgi:hypothetical protein
MAAYLGKTLPWSSSTRWKVTRAFAGTALRVRSSVWGEPCWSVGVEGDLLHGAEVFAVVLAQGEDGVARAEHLFPEVREGSGGGAGVDSAAFLGVRLCVVLIWGLGVEGRGQREGEQESGDGVAKDTVHRRRTRRSVEEIGKKMARKQTI